MKEGQQPPRYSGLGPLAGYLYPILRKGAQPPRPGQPRSTEPGRRTPASPSKPPATQPKEVATFHYVPTPPNAEDRPSIRRLLAIYKDMTQPETPEKAARTEDTTPTKAADHTRIEAIRSELQAHTDHDSTHTDVTLAPLHPLDAIELPGVRQRLGIWQAEQKKNKTTEEEE